MFSELVALCNNILMAHTTSGKEAAKDEDRRGRPTTTTKIFENIAQVK